MCTEPTEFDLPVYPRRSKHRAPLLWMLFDLIRNGQAHQYQQVVLRLDRDVYLQLGGVRYRRRLRHAAAGGMADHLAYAWDARRELCITVRPEMLFLDIKRAIARSRLLSRAPPKPPLQRQQDALALLSCKDAPLAAQAAVLATRPVSRFRRRRGLTQPLRTSILVGVTCMLGSASRGRVPNPAVPAAISRTMADRRSPSPETTIEAEAPRVLLAGILATGLAAALVAVLTSYLGVQGTVAGAMVGAMAGSALSQVVGVPLDRLERWLVQHGLLVVRRRRRIPAARVQAVRVIGASNAPWTAKFGWRVLAVCGLGFLVGMAGISGFELTQGKPLSASTARQDRTGTTVGNLVHPSGVESEPPTAEPTPAQLTEATVQAQSPGPTSTSARPTAEGARTLVATFTPTVLAPAVPSATPAKSTAVATTPRVTAVTPTPGSRPQTPTPTSTTLRPVSPPDATIRPAGTPPPTARVTAYAFMLATDQYPPFPLRG